MADQVSGNPSDGQADKVQVNEGISFVDLAKKLGWDTLDDENLNKDKLRKEAMDVLKEWVGKSPTLPLPKGAHGSYLNLDVLGEMSKSYNEKTQRAAKFEWRDEDLQLIEKVMNLENDDLKGEKIEKVYNDPIHGNIKIHPVCQAIIDTQEFQRLRDLKQMGMVSHVYPGAVHTRFEHSLGVCYLAGEFARQLQRNQPFLNITTEDILCVEIAGLCHDLGHGPFSHLFDEVMKDLQKEKYVKHEKRSVALLDLLIDRNKDKLKESFKQYGLWNDADGNDCVDENELTFIREMIVPDLIEAKTGRHKLKHFLYEIVSNESTGVDVDKFDYLARDCHHLGIKNNFDHRRFMMFARVNFKDGVSKICVRDKELPNLFNMYITRYTQQKFVWYHHVNTSAELMLSNAFQLAAPHLKLHWMENGEAKHCLLEDCTEDGNYVCFSQLTDNITTQILLSKDGKMSDAQKILQRILKRDFYKSVYESKPFDMNGGMNKEELSKYIEEIEQQIHKAIGEKSPEFAVKDGSNKEAGSKDFENETSEAIGEKLPLFAVKVYSLDLGKKDKTPLDYMQVYSKADPYTAKAAEEASESKILYPVTCIEYIVRVIYCGDDRKQGDRLKEVAKPRVDEKVKEIKKKDNPSGPGPSEQTRVS